MRRSCCDRLWNKTLFAAVLVWMTQHLHRCEIRLLAVRAIGIEYADTCLFGIGFEFFDAIPDILTEQNSILDDIARFNNLAMGGTYVGSLRCPVVFAVYFGQDKIQHNRSPIRKKLFWNSSESNVVIRTASRPGRPQDAEGPALRNLRAARFARHLLFPSATPPDW